METILFVVGLNILMFIWIGMWQRTFLDDSRDKLFDLRQEVRTFFLRNNLPLDNSVYVNLRNLLNSEIRYLEDLTFYSLFGASWLYSKNPELTDYIERSIDQLFATENKELEKYAKKVRERAIHVLILHMVRTSVFLMVSVLVTMLYMVATSTAKRLSRKTSIRSLPSRLSNKIRKYFYLASHNTSERLVKNPRLLEDFSLVLRTN